MTFELLDGKLFGTSSFLLTYFAHWATNFTFPNGPITAVSIEQKAAYVLDFWRSLGVDQRHQALLDRIFESSLQSRRYDFGDRLLILDAFSPPDSTAKRNERNTEVKVPSPVKNSGEFSERSMRSSSPKRISYTTSLFPCRSPSKPIPARRSERLRNKSEK